MKGCVYFSNQFTKIYINKFGTKYKTSSVPNTTKIKHKKSKRAKKSKIMARITKERKILDGNCFERVATSLTVIETVSKSYLTDIF